MRLLHLIRKEFLELRRDPRLFGIVIVAPIVQLTMLGCIWLPGDLPMNTG